MNFFVKKIVYSDIRQSKTKSILTILFTILISILIAITIACITCNSWNNFGKIFITIFKPNFSNMFQVNQILSSSAILIVAGLSFIFAYKAGLFNIGISGQMVMAGTVGTIICHLANIKPGCNQIVVLLACILFGAIIGGLIGMLKAFLNVNEVVSSIMFNWIIYYLSILTLSSLNMPKTSSGDYTDLPSNSLLLRLPINGSMYPFLPLLIIAFCLAIILLIILRYTVFGKKQKITGLSKTFAFSSGYNIKTNLILAMAISGGIAGILGAMVYCGYNPGMPVTSIAKSIPQEGFNGISVGLISMCNPLATIPIGFIFSFIQCSSSSLQTLGIDTHIVDVIFGIVVYGLAIISLFLNIKPYWLTLKIFKGKNYSKLKLEQNLSNLNLINITNDYKMQLKKYYLLNKKIAKAKSSLNFNFWIKCKMQWANILYNILLFKLKLFKKSNNSKINSKLYLLQNLRSGLTYRQNIVDQNMNNILYFKQVSLWAKQMNLSIIKDKKQYRTIKKYFTNAWKNTNKLINDFYKNCFKKMTKNNTNLDIYKFDSNKIQTYFQSLCTNEIKKNIK